MNEENLNSKKWKTHLLSSSLPLEYEVAKILVKEKFSVEADFSYTRNSEGEQKDFSVDIHATGYIPFGSKNDLHGRLELLVECKHSLPNKKWLFTLEPNEPEFNPILFSSFRVFDGFSSYQVNNQNLTDLDRTLTGVYKGVEINLADGNVSDTGIKSGISQLRYALPDLLGRQIWHGTICHPVDSIPFIVTAILVTTTELFVAKDNFTMEAVRNAASLEDIADKEDFVVFYSNGSPDFDSHRSKAFIRLSAQYGLSNNEPLLVERARILHTNKKSFLMPNPMSDCFSPGNFTHFIVCSFDKLPQLLKQLKMAAEKDIKTKQLVFTEEQMEKIRTDRVKKTFR